MWGFVIGTIGLVGLVFTARRRHGGCRRRFGLARHLAHELDASPAQARAIEEELEDWRARKDELRPEWRAFREDLGRIVASPHADREALEALFDDRASTVRSLRDAIVSSLQRVHDVLDESQRERLARLIANGPRSRRRRPSPYRGATS